jgi:hypothetical protein
MWRSILIEPNPENSNAENDSYSCIIKKKKIISIQKGKGAITSIFKKKLNKK